MKTLSWKLEVDFNTQNHLFTNTINTDYQINTFICNCGNNEFILSHKYDDIDYICDNCENTIFHNPNKAISHTEYFLYDFSNEVSIKDEYGWRVNDYQRYLKNNLKLDVGIHHKNNTINSSLYFEVPFSIDFISKKIFTKRCTVLEYGLDAQNKLYTNYKIGFKDDKLDILSDKLTEYVNNNSEVFNIPKNTKKSKTTISTIQFFNKHNHFKDYEFYLWENSKKYHRTGISIEKALVSLSNRDEKSIRKVIFKNYELQIQFNNKYNHCLIEIFCKNFKDPNLVVQAIDLKIIDKNFDSVNIDIISNLIVFLQSYYTDIQIIKALKVIKTSTDISFFIDMLNNFSAYDNSENDTFSKVKCNIKSLHDEFVKCSYSYHHQKIWNKSLQYSKKEHSRCKTIIEYEVRLPLTGSALLLWADTLHNCLSSYFSSIENNVTTVYGFFKNNIIEFAVEVVNDNIVQARGKYNMSLNKVQTDILSLWKQSNINQQENKLIGDD